jgi:hypothetical protein
MGQVLCCSLYSKEDFDAIGGYDPDLDRIGLEDFNLWCRLMKYGCRFGAAPDAIFYYRVHRDSHTHRLAQTDSFRYPYVINKNKSWVPPDKPTYSICHTTARPDAWQASARAWISMAANRGNLEYVLCADERWGFSRREPPALDCAEVKVVWNAGRQCCVDGFNTAAAYSLGEVLILNSDDMFPCRNWDTQITNLVGGRRENEFVIAVGSGTWADSEPDCSYLMQLPILSRSRYQRFGYALYPEYESIRAHDDFSEHARHDGVVINGRNILIQHTHDVVSKRHVTTMPWDMVYVHQNRQLSIDIGDRVLVRRRAEKFVK